VSDGVGELRAAVEGCEVVVRFTDGHAMSPALRAALAELADAMYAEQAMARDEEVSGFNLAVGSLGLSSTSPSYVTGEESCWGYTVGEHCWWYRGPRDRPGSCSIHSFT
jgi:hypothetical protein